MTSPENKLHIRNNIKRGNKHHLHTSILFQKSTFYADIQIFNSLPPSVTVLKNDKENFKAALIPKYTLLIFCR